MPKPPPPKKDLPRQSDSDAAPWIPVFRPGSLGRNRDAKLLAWNQLFDKGRWRLAYRWADRTLVYHDALQLYEDAYMAHLQSNPNLVEWICATASDVYDNAESNVESGLDYRIQETGATHLQDIAVRRCLMRLGRWFRGRKLLEIRGRQSEGGCLTQGPCRSIGPSSSCSRRSGVGGIPCQSSPSGNPTRSWRRTPTSFPAPARCVFISRW